VTADQQEIYLRYLRAGAFARDADALAELFTADGVLEAPLVPRLRTRARGLIENRLTNAYRGRASFLAARGPGVASPKPRS
jgi:hypothetical protein